MVGDRVEELLRREENRALLDGLEEASRRVDRAREALADIERQEAEVLRTKEYIRQLESRESEVSFDSLALCSILCPNEELWGLGIGIFQVYCCHTVVR